MADSMTGIAPAPIIANSVPADLVMQPAPVNPASIPNAAELPTTPTVPPEVVTETLYIQNLNERIKLNVMKQTLHALFLNYGDVLDVVAHRNLRMRGQAFVSFADASIAKKAQREVNRFPLYSKPMQISFARTRSDAVVKTVDLDHFDQHKAARLEHKKKTRYNNPLKRKFRARRLAEKMDGAALPAPKRPAVQMPDEYLPPNKILFLQNLPESVTDSKDQLLALFSQYPNLHDVRLIPTKKDIAFVEYSDEASATAAKDALHNYKLDGEHKIKITYARK
ncbi:RNA-binding domain-containing protein [Fomitiporia mediterranea MF3/22]|uniref:RNA-binding domain-containing protein n=1 Tax=Fomitiporia mediterranea (strain MF3/22) TaxID=694068 RepID=UPI0004409958|nr:RNA-binding domain-containing protein [Fomitiporia mediterranea MF3/22]EJD03796.1 RNA-binding domain-containing protein [Fomitiporia mediterranea MF3/22]